MAKILLVEDNEMNSDMLSRRLQRRGYEVVVAEDGVKGMVSALAESPDLILMDMSFACAGWMGSDPSVEGKPKHTTYSNHCTNSTCNEWRSPKMH